MQSQNAVTVNNTNSQWRLCGALILFVIAGLASAGRGLADCVPAPPGLIGWWPGDGNLTDIFGGNNGTAQGGLTANTNGFVGQAMSFDGTNGYVSVPESPLWHPTNVTVEFWVRFNSLDSAGTSPAGQQYIVFKQNSRSTVFEGFAVYKSRYTSPARDLFVFGLASAAGQPLEVVATNAISAGVWYHVAAVRGSNFARIYVNGQLHTEMAVSFPQDYGTLPLFFGTSGQPSWDHKLKGLLDEVAIYDRALSSAEIASIYTAGAAGKCKGLTITAQPQSRTNVVGSNGSFSVGAAGTPPLTYQWQFGGENIAGATLASLSLTNIQTTNAGNYAAVVTDANSSSLTSVVAVLTVIVPPSITLSPVSITNDAGATVIFGASASGSAPLSYLWQLNSAPLTNGGRFSGVTTDTLTITGILPSDAGNYRLVVSNAAGSDTSASASLTVTGPPSIQIQPAPSNVNAGGTANFSVAASGTQPLSYQWQRGGVDLLDGGIVSGATTSALTLTAVTTNDAGGYRVVITNIAGAITSQVASLTINLPPSITTPPASQTAAVGTNVTFTVTAAGAGPLRYQWLFNGANLASSTTFTGVTNATLSLNYVLPANAGGYSVVVTNAYGAITSAVATLTVSSPTNCYTALPGLIGWWPGDGNARDIVGTNHGVFQGGAAADGQGVVGQAFRFDGTNHSVMIPDSPQLHLPVLTVECWVKFRNLNGDGNSSLPGQQYMIFKNNSRSCNDFEAFVLSKDREPGNDAFLWEVTSANGNLIRSDSKTKVVTNTWYHVVGVAGTNYLEMYVNGVMETNVTFNFPLDYGNGKPLMFGSSGEACYDRKLDGVMDEVALYNRPLSSNEVAALYAGSLAGRCKGTNGLFITTHPLDKTVPVGANVTFTSGAAGGSAIGYQWQFNGNPIPGATSSNLFLTNVQVSGSYRVVATNASGTQASAPATLTVIPVPTISAQPTNRTVVAGNPANFSVTATGEPLAYQWRFFGTNLAGQTIAELSLPDAQPAQAGDYSVVITNLSGSVTSEVATLTVLIPPYIVVQPVNVSAFPGGTANFNVVAGGTGPFDYQWKFNGTNVDNAFSDSLALVNVQAQQAGGYSVTVTSAAGSTNSATALLSILHQPVLLSPAGSVTDPFAFVLSGDAGHTYAIEVTTNFQDWSPLITITNATGEVQFSDPTSSNSVTRFYRARFNE